MIGTIRVADVLALKSVENKGTVADQIVISRTHATYPETLESIRRYGVENPILIRFEELCNGHHRVAACVDLGIEDVVFTDDPLIGWANEFEWPEEKEVACHD